MTKECRVELAIFLAFLIIGGFFLWKVAHNTNNSADNRREQEIEKEIEILERNSASMNPQEFFKFFEASRKNKKNLHAYDGDFTFSGIYVLHNLTRDKHYVGQSINVMKRVNTHFTGRHGGNKSVYADFKHGDKWNIRLIDMKFTNYSNLNDLEKYAIQLYKGYDKGYNKTRGNKSD